MVNSLCVSEYPLTPLLLDESSAVHRAAPRFRSHPEHISYELPAHLSRPYRGTALHMGPAYRTYVPMVRDKRARKGSALPKCYCRCCDGTHCAAKTLICTQFGAARFTTALQRVDSLNSRHRPAQQSQGTGGQVTPAALSALLHCSGATVRIRGPTGSRRPALPPLLRPGGDPGTERALQGPAEVCYDFRMERMQGL